MNATCDCCAERKDGCVYYDDDPNGATLCPECVAALPQKYELRFLGERPGRHEWGVWDVEADDWYRYGPTAFKNLMREDAVRALALLTGSEVEA